jgi:CPA2 family monovalent cation:H+ antiporter-2
MDTPSNPMPHDASIPFIREIVIFLVVAAIVVPLFHRIRVSPVLGFLLTGVIIGPYGLGAFTSAAPWLHYVTYDDVASVRTLAELGVVFLLFVIGLEMSFERLWAMRRLVLGLGPAQIGISALVIGCIAWAWGNTTAAAIVIGASFALSSTAVVMEELIARAEFPTRAGRAAFSVLLCQDLAVVPLLILVPALAGSAHGSTAVAIGTGLATALAAGAGLYLLGRLVLRPLFHLAAGARAPEFFVAITLLTAIGAAAATTQAGLGPALGAFLAGLMLADSEFRHQVQADIAPFKGLLMGLFFISVGMAINTQAVADLVFWVAASVAGLILIKAGIITLLGCLFSLPLPVAVHVGLLLGQGGEFALLALGIAMQLDIVPIATGQFMLMVVSLSMLATPGLAALGSRIATTLERRRPPATLAPEQAELSELSDHVIIAGFGRVGRAVATLLTEEGVPYVALDVDPVLVARHRRHDEPVYFGDGRRTDVLRQVGVERARAVVLTLDEQNAAEQAVSNIRRGWSELPVYARSRDREHATALEKAGATRTVSEMTESSLQIGAVVLGGLGVPGEVVAALVERVRDSGYEGL